ncbi:hypothetical protein HBF26_17120 [Luteibacter jiangsuensis]|uniref:Uncharacterized protein n=1 Tax=Luteibacter jiangsuensis TaxID=637577 RepID=A0ABX0Q7Y7_9GAMM|nr:hypothetical protein [Luteibacter jiangsuensis]NID06619.1 hypothetical protein [Luteibacter jiangsuensis]
MSTDTIRAEHEALTIGNVSVSVHTMRRACGEGRCAVEFDTGAGSLRCGFHGSNDEWRAFASALIKQLDEADQVIAQGDAA